jgi:hypothetical protein
VGRVYLVTQRLEAELYNDQDIYDHLSALATSNRNTDIRIIAHDTRVAANQGHQLIHLAQRLPSFVQIRLTVTTEHRNFRESWLIADDSAYMRIRNPERYLNAGLTTMISSKCGRPVNRTGIHDGSASSAG